MLSILFTILAGISNAFMDLSAENLFLNNKFNKSKGPNNDENKWKQPLEPGKRMWWYLWLKKPMYKESFIWSSTILVKFTDWWHLFQSFMILFFCLSMVFYSPITDKFVFNHLTQDLFWSNVLMKTLDVIILVLTFGFSFENVYATIKRKLLNKSKS